MKSIKKTYEVFWPLVRSYKKIFFLGVFLILLSTLIEISLPLIIGKVIDSITNEKKLSNVYFYSFLFLGLLIIKSIFQSAQAFVIQKMGQGVTHDLRTHLLSHIQLLPISYFDTNASGRLLTRVTNDIKALSELFTASISVLALDVMVILGTLVAMFYLETKLSFWVLLTFPLAFFTIEYFGKRLADSYIEVRKYLSQINAFLGENIGAISTIQRLSIEKERLAHFENRVHDHFESQLNSVRLYALIQPYANIINGISMATLIALGGAWVVSGKISLGILVAFFGYLRNLFQPIRDLVEKYNIFLSAQSAAERVMDILDEKGEPKGGGYFKEGSQDYEIEFKELSFCYPTREKKSLEEISFELKESESLAIVGRTGSGKTTLIRLLLKFYPVEPGKIFISGVDILDWDTASLRSLFGVVHQEMYFFGGTLRENLTLGRENLSETYLIEQCKKAELWSLIENRGGLDLKIHEGGSNLSLGERQLLAFARVLTLNPPILILDEATSSMDTVLEEKIIRVMQEIMQGRTSIVIAHRLSTIQHCNKVIKIEEGRIIDTEYHSK